MTGRRDPVAVGAVAVLVLVTALAAAAPVVAAVTGHGPDEQLRDSGLSPAGIPVGPGGEFWLGADGLGRDVAVRIAYGARVSLVAGLGASVLAVVVGVAVGLVTGYLGGAVDAVLGRLADVALAVPFLLLAIALVSVTGPGLGVSVLVIAAVSWAPVARLVRGEVLGQREREYVTAARALGAGRTRVMVAEVLPNVAGPALVAGTLLVPTAIVLEATLSFLGLGVVPPTPSWGGMLAESVPFYRVAWWLVVFPGAALLLVTLAVNLLGDTARDAVGPGR